MKKQISFRRTLTLCAVSAALMVSQTSYAFSLSGFISDLTGGNKTTTNENIAANPLAESVSKGLNVTPEQAAGGVGALLAAASGQLSGQDSKQLSSIIPGMDALHKAIPQELSALVTPQTLNPIFTALGLNPKMVNQFVPSILGFAKQHGASASLIQSLEKAWAPIAPAAIAQNDASQALTSAKATVDHAENAAEASMTELKQSTQTVAENVQTGEKAQLDAAKAKLEQALTNAENKAQQQSAASQATTQQQEDALKEKAASALNKLSDSINSAAKSLQQNTQN
jgi:hypothetical protein